MSSQRKRTSSGNTVSSDGGGGGGGGKKKSKSQKSKLTPLTEVDNVTTFLVDKILDRKFDGYGKPLYLIRWLGYKEEDDTWEPTRNIPEAFVAKYDSMLESNRKAGIIKTTLDISETTQFKLSTTCGKSAKFIPRETKNIFGILRKIAEGKQLMKILSVACVEEELIYLVLFEGENEPNMVLSSALTSSFPQEVIDFCNSKTEFDNTSGSKIRGSKKMRPNVVDKFDDCSSNSDLDLAKKAVNAQIKFSRLEEIVNQDSDDDSEDEVFYDAEDGSGPNVKLDQYGLPMLGEGFVDEVVLSSDSDTDN